MTDEDVRAAVAAHSAWYHRIELRPGIVTPGINDSRRILELLELPDDLSGKTVLDIGARDGFFAFECERRGAKVTAVDYYPAEGTGFALCARVLGSNVSFVQENIFHLTPERFGTFDLVLMLGLLYHLRDPLGALDIVHRLCADRCIVETHILDNHLVLGDRSVVPLESIDPRLATLPIMQFYPGRTLNNDATNYWAPNIACLEAMASEAGFAVQRTHVEGNRAILHATAEQDPMTLYQRSIARGDTLPRAQ